MGDILSIFNLNSENYRFKHPKNNNFELSIFEELAVFKLNERKLEIMALQNIDRCVICLSQISYESDEYCRISGCSHIYHFECIQNLIKYSNDNQCPLCRGKIKYVQYLYNNTINKIFKIKNNTLSIISHKHYFNKYYHHHSIKNKQNKEEEEDYDYDEKEEATISNMVIPQKPCLGYLQSMPSPTNSNSSISIPPTRHSPPSSPSHNEEHND